MDEPEEGEMKAYVVKQHQNIHCHGIFMFLILGRVEFNGAPSDEAFVLKRYLLSLLRGGAHTGFNKLRVCELNPSRDGCVRLVGPLLVLKNRD